MPASRFFLMLESARRLKSAELVQQCYVARSSAVTFEAFGEITKYFDSIGGQREKPMPPEPPSFQPPTLKASSPAAKQAVMAAFAKDRRINRPAQPRAKPTKKGP